MSNANPIDPKALDLLHSLEADRPGSMGELIRLFIADAPGQMQNIDDGYSERNHERVRQAAHFLRSGAMALGLTRLAEVSHAVERLELANYGQESAEQSLAGLRVQLRDALVALLNEVKQI